jgi:WD40 repeat protein
VHFKLFIFAFSSCGRYLASQGGSLDQTLTVWDWNEEMKISERTLPTSSPAITYQVLFAEADFKRLTTCGELCDLSSLKAMAYALNFI